MGRIRAVATTLRRKKIRLVVAAVAIGAAVALCGCTSVAKSTDGLITVTTTATSAIPVGPSALITESEQWDLDVLAPVNCGDVRTGQDIEIYPGDGPDDVHVFSGVAGEQQTWYCGPNGISETSVTITFPPYSG